MSPTQTYGTQSKFRYLSKVGLTSSYGAKFCPTHQTLVTVSAAVKVGYEINFNRHFYKPQRMRSLEEIRADILALENDTEGLLAGILGQQNQPTLARAKS